MSAHSSNPVIFIVTHSNDNASIRLVMDAVAERGGAAYRFDTDCFPTEIRLTIEYSKTRERLLLQGDNYELDLDSVSALWYRRIAMGYRIPRSMDAQLRKASVGESRATVHGMIASLEAFHLDPVYRLRRAENKQLQLKVARELGIETPRTLITNEPEAVRHFARECPNGMVMKMLSSFAIYEESEEKVVFTNPVQSHDLDHLEQLRYCPATFQELIPKALELRVTVVGDRVFTASIDSQKSDKSSIDWRRDGMGLIEDWEPCTLPPEVEEKLLRLMHFFRLNYGAADFIVTPDGRHIFLEVNPVGEFFWLELKNPKYPISRAIAERLIAGRSVWD
ncbi:MAG: MvdD family ATP-grasp ribosomal peptide maturase [Methylococcales bacterium]